MSLRLGILGATRGLEFAFAAKKCGLDVTCAAVCDNYPPVLEKVRARLPEAGFNPAYFTDYGEMLEKGGIDAVIVANNATDHAAAAIAALDRGLAVLSEVLPVQTLGQAVALADAVDRAGGRYAYAENYCFLAANFQLARRFRAGEIGDLVAGEADFINDCSQRWHLLARGLRNHWRNHVPATFYCTHSLAPLFYATRRRPVRVTGFEVKCQDYMRVHGARSGSAAMEVVELDDGSFLRSLHGNLKRPWLSRVRLFGTKGTLETADAGHYTAFVENEAATGYNDYDVKPGDFPAAPDVPPAVQRVPEAFILWSFLGLCAGDRRAAEYAIGLPEALDMFLPGFFAHLSILDGGRPVEIPDFRDPAVRARFRDDRRCTDPSVASGADLLPSYGRGEIVVPDEVYAHEAARLADALAARFHLGMN